jgi:hypothetical protein
MVYARLRELAGLAPQWPTIGIAIIDVLMGHYESDAAEARIQKQLQATGSGSC